MKNPKSKVRAEPILQKRLPGMPADEDDGSFYWYTHFMLVQERVTLAMIQEITARHLKELKATCP